MSEDVFRAVAADLRDREAIGWSQHGKPLLTFNGRNALREAYEEALDLSVYLKQALLEQELDAALEYEPLDREWPSFGVKLACLSTFVAFGILAIVGGVSCLG